LSISARFSFAQKNNIEHTFEHSIYTAHISLTEQPQINLLQTRPAIMASQGSTLDMSLFFGTAEQKHHFCHELLRLLKCYGCVKITNHSIPDEDVHKLFGMVGNTSSHDSSPQGSSPTHC
jgi:hypothetical protein